MTASWRQRKPLEISSPLVHPAFLTSGSSLRELGGWQFLDRLSVFIRRKVWQCDFLCISARVQDSSSASLGSRDSHLKPNVISSPEYVRRHRPNGLCQAKRQDHSFIAPSRACGQSGFPFGCFGAGVVYMLQEMSYPY